MNSTDAPPDPSVLDNHARLHTTDHLRRSSACNEASTAGASQMSRAQPEEPARRIVSKRKHGITSNMSVVVHGLWGWLESTAGTISRAAKRVFQLPLHLATNSDHVPDYDYLAGVKYDPLIPTWFGASFDVHEGTWFRSRTAPTGRVVVKRLRVKMKGHEDRFMHGGTHIKGLTRRHFDHPNIVKLLGVLREENDGHERLALVFVRMEGELRSFLHSVSYNPRADRKRLLIEIAGALVHLHGQGIVHGNVSLRKVLVKHRHAFLNAGSLMIGDENTRRVGVFRGGAVQYMAPESLFSSAEDAWDDGWFGDDETMEPTSLPARTAEGDAFAFGRLIFAIVIKDNPFGAVNDAVVLDKMRLGHPRKRPPSSTCYGAPMPDSLWELTRACWQMEPEKRPTMRDVLRSLSSPGFDA